MQALQQMLAQQKGPGSLQWLSGLMGGGQPQMPAVNSPGNAIPTNPYAGGSSGPGY